MSADDGNGGASRRLSRRKFLAIGATGAAAGLLAPAAYLRGARAQTESQTPPQPLLYRGRRIVVEERGGRPQLFIDGKPITTVNTNGAFRAAGFMFSPQDTLVALAKKMIDYQIALGGYQIVLGG